MGKKSLTPGAVAAILQLRAKTNEWGEPRYSAQQIAQETGSSESTVWRVIKKQAAYARIQNIPREDEAQEILQRVLAATQQATKSQDPVVAAAAAEHLEELDKGGEV